MSVQSFDFYPYLFYFVFSGLVSLEMPLSIDPQLGSWSVVVDKADRKETVSFKVDEYGEFEINCNEQMISLTSYAIFKYSMYTLIISDPLLQYLGISNPR